MKRREDEQRKQAEVQLSPREGEQKEIEHPIYQAPQVFVIDTAVHLMKGDFSGSQLDGLSGFIFNS